MPLKPLCLEIAWAALRIIREMIEELGPVGALTASEEVMHRYGLEPVHDARPSAKRSRRSSSRGLTGRSATGRYRKLAPCP